MPTLTDCTSCAFEIKTSSGQDDVQLVDPNNCRILKGPGVFKGRVQLGNPKDS